MFCGSGSGVQVAQAAQGILHRHGASHQAGRTGIGTEFALPREPGDDNAGQNAEDDFADQAGHHVTDARAAAFPSLRRRKLSTT